MNPREGASGIFMLYRRAQAHGHFVVNILLRGYRCVEHRHRQNQFDLDRLVLY